MTVTSISIYNIRQAEEGICAKAEVVIDGCLVARNIRIINGRKGLFIAFPNDGKYNIVNGGKRYNDIFYVKDPEERNKLQDMIIDKYKEMTACV